jgi:hypothetical protein
LGFALVCVEIDCFEFRQVGELFDRGRSAILFVGFLYQTDENFGRFEDNFSFLAICGVQGVGFCTEFEWLCFLVGVEMDADHLFEAALFRFHFINKIMRPMAN